MSWAQNVLGTESLIWAQNVQAQNRRLKIAGTESLGTKSGTFASSSGFALWNAQHTHTFFGGNSTSLFLFGHLVKLVSKEFEE